MFAERAPDSVTVRDVAAAAGVSPALVVRHYGSKDGLRAVVDDHVTQTFERMLAQALDPDVAGPFEEGAVPTLADLVAGSLPPGSPIPAYLGRLLVGGGSVGAALFDKLYAVSREALSALVDQGQADPGGDPEVRAAFLLVNDLAVLILRSRLREVLGIDPLSAAGMRRWGTEVLSIYRHGLGAVTPDR